MERFQFCKKIPSCLFRTSCLRLYFREKHSSRCARQITMNYEKRVPAFACHDRALASVRYTCIDTGLISHLSVPRGSGVTRNRCAIQRHTAIPTNDFGEWSRDCRESNAWQLRDVYYYKAVSASPGYSRLAALGVKRSGRSRPHSLYPWQAGEMNSSL